MQRHVLGLLPHLNIPATFLRSLLPAPLGPSHIEHGFQSPWQTALLTKLHIPVGNGCYVWLLLQLYIGVKAEKNMQFSDLQKAFDKYEVSTYIHTHIGQ